MSESEKWSDASIWVKIVLPTVIAAVPIVSSLTLLYSDVRVNEEKANRNRIAIDFVRDFIMQNFADIKADIAVNQQRIDRHRAQIELMLGKVEGSHKILLDLQRIFTIPQKKLVPRETI